MHLTRYLDDVVAWAPAKVNLYLEILGKRPDGYHELETLMVTAGLFDTLVLRDGPAGRVELACSDPALSAGEDNLVVRAARLLQQRTGGARGCRVRLVKRIPMAAGLAGGSADAAATLVACNELWQAGLSQAQLARVAARLGSDVPFSLVGGTAVGRGRGELLTPALVSGTYYWVLAFASGGLSTPEV